MTAESGTFEDRFLSTTAAYLDQIEECVLALPDLLSEYEADGAYRKTATRIGDIEGTCDLTQRRIGAQIAAADAQDLGIRLSRLHLNTGPTIELVQLLDEIPNTAERFADELVAIRPSLAPRTAEQLQSMAACAVEAMAALRNVVRAYVRLLVNQTQSDDLRQEITQVRRLESTCDDLRNDLVTAAFGDAAAEDPMLDREFALMLDTLADTMEDVTDRIILVSSTASWIDVDLEVPRA